MTAAVLPSNEPTPDFYARTAAVIEQWEVGQVGFDHALDSLMQLRLEADAAQHTPNQARAEQMLGYLLVLRGSLIPAIRHFERNRALFAEVGNRRRVIIADLNLGEAYRQRGDFKRARAYFTKAYQAANELEDREQEAVALCNMGQMLLTLGDLPAAYTALTESYALALQFPLDDPDRTGLLCELHHALAMLYLRRGERVAAWHEAKLGYWIALEANKPYERGFACRAVAEVLLHLAAPDDGFSADMDAYYHAAMVAFHEIQVEGEVGRTLLAHARSLAARGRKLTAARKLREAMLIFARLGMLDDAARAAELQRDVM
jgi:tetratricopeptide (TPR) repeat protein